MAFCLFNIAFVFNKLISFSFWHFTQTAETADNEISQNQNSIVK